MSKFAGFGIRPAAARAWPEVTVFMLDEMPIPVAICRLTHHLARRIVMAENAVRWFEIYLQDMARARRFVEKTGGRIQRAKMSIGPYGFIVLAVDTEGNLIGLHSLA